MAQAAVVTRATGKIEAEDATIEIDAVKAELHTFADSVTDHPVESGDNISDHSRPEPNQLTLECVVSNTPLPGAQQERAVKQDGFTFQTTSDAVAIGQVDGRARQTYDRLVSFRGKQLTVVTTLRVYTSMLITSVSVPRTAQNSDSLTFSVTFKHVRVVRNKQTREVKAKDKRVGKATKKGNQTPFGPEGPPTSTALKRVESSLGRQLSTGAEVGGGG